MQRSRTATARIALAIASALLAASALMAGLLAPSPAYAARAEEGSYAAVYGGDTFVIGRGQAPSEYDGKALTASWQGVETAIYETKADLTIGGEIVSTAPWYKGYASAITSVAVVDPLSPSSIRGWFYRFANCTSMDLALLDTSNVTSLASAFYRCSSLTTLDLSSWDVSKVTDMLSAFYRCTSLESLDVSSWDVSKVERFRTAFMYCSSLTSLDLSGWDTSSATTMNGMFEGCSELATLEVGEGWDTSGVTDVRYMFKDCSELTLDCSGWSSENITQDEGFNEGAGCVSLPGEDPADPEDPDKPSLLFSDVLDDAWYLPAVEYVCQNSIMSGYGNGLFGPGDNLTRGQAAVVLWRFYEPEEAAGHVAEESVNETGIRDVADGAYYTEAVNWAVENGIIRGYKDPATGQIAGFGPNDPLTREQLCVIMGNVVNWKHGVDINEADGGKFEAMSDSSSVSDWAVDAVSWTLGNGIINGVLNSDGTRSIEPRTPVSRAMIAQVMMNSIEGGVL